MGFLGAYRPVEYKAIVGISFGDSTWEGVIGPREAEDTDWPGVYELKADDTISSDTTPMRRFGGPADSLCPQEYWGKERNADTGLPVYMVQYAVGGSGLNDEGNWLAPSGSNLVNAVTQANKAVAAAIAAYGSPVKIEFTGDIGTNDGAVGSAATWFGRLDDLVEHFRANVYKNGVSGETVGTDGAFGFVVPQPEWACINSVYRQIAFESRRMAGTKTNCFVYSPPNGQTAGDNLHPTIVGARANGTGLANAFAETVAPTVALSDFTIYSGQKLAREITADKIAWFTLSGADAAQFEIAEIARSSNYGGGDLNAAQTKFVLRWAGNGDAPAAGTYNVNIVAKGNAPTASTKAIVVTVAAAYGSAVEDIAATYTDAPSASTSAGTLTFSNVHFKRGVNTFALAQTAGGISGYTSATASNGLVGVADASNSGDQGAFHFYSAQDETVDIAVVQTGTTGDCYGSLINLVGTTATPTASAISTAATVSQTVSANGIAIVQGFSTSGTTPPSGQTDLTCTGTEADPGVQYAGYRTTTGDLGAQGGFARLFASSWAKA